jgi:hypothetical protein
MAPAALATTFLFLMVLILSSASPLAQNPIAWATDFKSGAIPCLKWL